MSKAYYINWGCFWFLYCCFSWLSATSIILHLHIYIQPLLHWVETHPPVSSEQSRLPVILCTWSAVLAALGASDARRAWVGFCQAVLASCVHLCMRVSRAQFFHWPSVLRLGFRLCTYLKNLPCGHWVSGFIGGIIPAQFTTWDSQNSGNSSASMLSLETPVSRFAWFLQSVRVTLLHGFKRKGRCSGQKALRKSYPGNRRLQPPRSFTASLLKLLHFWNCFHSPPGAGNRTKRHLTV